MRIVNPSVLLLEQPISPEDVMRRIELCGRVCYKSEGKITFNSYKGFIQRIIKRGHEAVLEHGNLIIGMSKDSDGGSGVWFSALDRAFEQTGTASYIRKTHGNAQNIVSGNVRAWRDVLRVCAATNNHLPDALECVKAWGFQYVTLITWCKDSMGLGQYFRGMTEHCIFATTQKKLPYKLEEGKRMQGVTGFVEPKREHSRKPETMRKMIERVSYTPRIELFARRAAPGWKVWGNEAPEEQEAAT